ncbi:hypothetical protein [Glutamicibacter arilaitensis]|uniref:hypothetical protein n=1 Tax=Glutamicibacter arilaitensis TaxID=256701 RepID=UPI003FCF3D6A
MNRPTPMDGNYGPRTSEEIHLFNKSDNYRAGYYAGKWQRPTKDENEYALAVANLTGGAYLDGFTMGRRAHKHGIKRPTRKAKR